jgi:hypothetical protein
MNHEFDAARLSLLLNDLRLPAIKQIWSSFAERSDKEGWPATRLLMALAEHEIAERDRRRIERHIRDAKLLPGKTLENFDFDAVPMVSRAHVSALCAGDGWLRNGANLILLGPSGGGKSHLSSAIGLSLLENGRKALSRVPPTSCSACRSRAASWLWSPPSTGWIASISLFRMTSHTSVRIRPRHRCCSSSSAPGMSTVPFS